MNEIAPPKIPGSIDAIKKEQTVKAVLELLDGLLLDDANAVLATASIVVAREARFTNTRL